MNIMKILVIAILALSAPILLFAEDSILPEINRGRQPIKVFVKEFVNESGQSQIKPEDFKKSFQGALLKRKAVKFELVNNPESSDIQISGIIKKYLYSKTDPITSYAGVGGLLLDAATTENYAEMTVDFIVINTKTEKVLWNKSVLDFIKHTMTPEESISMVYDKVSRTFLWRCFGKPNK